MQFLVFVTSHRTSHISHQNQIWNTFCMIIQHSLDIFCILKYDACWIGLFYNVITLYFGCRDAYSCNCFCLNACTVCSFVRKLIMCSPSSLSNWSVVVYVSVKVVHSGAFERCIVVRFHVVNPEWDVRVNPHWSNPLLHWKAKTLCPALNNNNGNNANKPWGIINWVLHKRATVCTFAIDIFYFIALV